MNMANMGMANMGMANMKKNHKSCIFIDTGTLSHFF